MVVRKGLGKGLEALLPIEVRESDVVSELNVDAIRPNPRQPRKSFNDSKLQELAESIKEHGVVQPVIVRNSGDGYEIVAGERRWRAAQIAGLRSIPAIIRQMNDAETMEIALIENIQREDLNAIEEARAYQELMQLLGVTQEQLAVRIGKSRPAIANAVRLLGLDERVQKMVEAGELSAGHARCLCGIGDPSMQLGLARRFVTEGLTVRAAEAAVRRALDGSHKGKARERVGGTTGQDLIIQALTDRLEERLSTRVRINGGTSRGVIEIEYFSSEELERLIEEIIGTSVSV